RRPPEQRRADGSPPRGAVAKRGSTPEGGGGARANGSLPRGAVAKRGDYPEEARANGSLPRGAVAKRGSTPKGGGGASERISPPWSGSETGGVPRRGEGARAKRARIAVSPRTYRTPTERSRPPNAFCSSTLDASTKRGHTAPPQMNRNHLRAQLVLLIPD